MSTTQDPKTIAQADDDYDEEEDTDFNPDANAAEDAAESSESDEEDTAETTGPKRKRTKPTTTTAEDIDFDNSGDEATIQRGKKRKRKDGGKTVDDDEGGEGGLIKTRAQRLVEQKERKKLATAEGANVDVDALWAQMAAPEKSKVEAVEEVKEQAHGATGTSAQAGAPTTKPAQDAEAMITIKRTYDFAGQTMTEEKSVPVSSAEAKLYVAEQARNQQEAAAARATSATAQKPGLRRPKKRVSIFGNKDAAAAQEGKAPKLTTLEKSKLDWAAHVDEEGIVEELEEHKKAKSGYLSRMDFLGRMDEKREGELKERKGQK